MDLMTRRRALLAQAQESGVLATATGNPMTFTTDLVRRLHSLVIPFTPIQAAGTPSPDNPLPISGWTGANVYNETAYNVSATPKLTINWQTESGIIYAGTFTLNEDRSVDIVPTHAEVDLGTRNWLMQTGNAGSFFQCLNGQIPIKEGITGTTFDMYCTNYKTMPTLTFHQIGAENNVILGRTGFKTVCVVDNRFTTAEDFKVAVSGVKLVYPLATPGNPIHIPNVGSLYTYLGTNTIWTDTNGTNTAEYWIKNT